MAVQVGSIDYGYENTEFLLDIMYYLDLSDQEKEVFKLRSAGYLFSEIAKIMGLTKARISQIWKSIRDKYDSLGE